MLLARPARDTLGLVRPARDGVGLVALGCALLTLTGCGTGQEAAETSLELPLDAFLADVRSHLPSAATEWTQIEELSARCMAEDGFEYLLQPVPEPLAEVGPEGIDQGSAEYVAEYGYGELTGGPIAGGLEVDGDPNGPSLSAMSQVELNAWLDALYGPWDAAAPPPEDAPQTHHLTTVEAQPRGDEGSGCRGWAERTYDEQTTGMDTGELYALTTLIDDLTAAVESDPRLTELDAAWSRCMAESGYPDLATIDDARFAVILDFDGAMGELQEHCNQTQCSLKTFEDLAWEKQEELARFEIAVATADMQCRRDSRYERRRLEITAELQQEFVDAHGAELQAWRETVLAMQS